MMQIARLTESTAYAHLDGLIALLADAVNTGASVGFLRPLNADLARDYWHDVFACVGKGTRIVLIARNDNTIVGSVQLDLCVKQNGVHRAEVQKLMVGSQYRRQGIATALMGAVEAEALLASRSLLVLDTEARSAAEPFYESRQWSRVG
ncbi:MAG: GNAT family N-acetyltransferase, partial [Candidatus Obscuribacterales bacterium]|nr:GNAT family N-acetyltransferase [Steroidobacteraceae bacterium]